jgi:integrase
MIEAHHATRPRQLHRLPANIIKIAKPGRFYLDGGGLRLVVSATGAAKWTFRYSIAGRVREAGLGSARTVSLAEARVKASAGRDLLAQGRDPLERAAAAAVRPFREVAGKLIASKSPAWRNDKHARQWGETIFTHCKAILDRPVDRVNTEDVLSVLKPIWQRTPETASRLRGRIEAVLDYAKAMRWHSGENPAAWRGHLKMLLPAPRKLLRGHHAALPYAGVPGFMTRLPDEGGTAALALRFLISTAARSGEVLGARWAEIDLDAKVWTVPASRMKGAREHRVPLSSRALAILEKLAEAKTGDFVFAGERRGKPISGMAMSMLLRRMKIEGATVHGFRSGFRDWAGNETGFPREVCEAALAHATGGAVERAYRRSDALEKRRVLMEAWAAFLDGAADNIVAIRA